LLQLLHEEVLGEEKTAREEGEREEGRTNNKKMTRRLPYKCDNCHALESKNNCLHVLHDDGLLLCPSCFNRELEHRRGAKEIRLNK